MSERATANEMEAEVIQPEPKKAELVDIRSPQVPATLDDLAARKGEAIEILEARVQILETMRKAAIRATSPEDWVLFRTKEGQVTGYLQDAGADRVRDIYGIEIFDVSRPEKIPATQAGHFHYLVTGSGHCKITKQTVELMEGGRSSNEDFCKDKTGAELELAVRKAARANLDGGITRELAGLKVVPLDELQAAWSGTNKDAGRCHKGRGFGSGAERRGAQVKQAPDIDPGQEPTCEICDGKMEYIPAGKKKDGKPYDAFWSCPKGFGRNKTHDQSTITHAEWLKRLKAQPAREPGEEG